MNSLNKIKKEFYENGFVHIKKIFLKDEIQQIFQQIEKIKKKSIKIKNPNMHFTTDNKLNTIHDINTYVKSGKMIEITKDKRMTKLLKKFQMKSKSKKYRIFLKPKKTGMRSPFHQDNFYWNIKKKKLKCLDCLFKASIKNGGVCYYKNLINQD